MTRIRSTDASSIGDRRRSGGGGIGMGGLGGFPLPVGGGIIGVLMLVAALVLPKVLGAGTGGDTLSPDAADGTCNSELEQIVCGATNDVQQYWTTAMPAAFSRPYESTKLQFFSGSTQTGCGMGTSQTGPFYCPADRFVYIDLEFLQRLENELVGATSDLAEQYIVAHEFGHHVQNILGDNARVEQAPESRRNDYSVALELQADCYAGAWVGDVNRRGLLDTSAEIQEALDAAAGVGDDRIQQKTQGRVDPESWTHGSAEQRQEWFRRGFDTIDPRSCDTFGALL